MCDPKLNINAINRALTESWVVTAIEQMKRFHNDGMCLDVAAKLVVAVSLAVASSVQATFDATENREFNTDHLRQLLDGILSKTPVPFQADNGRVKPVTLN